MHYFQNAGCTPENRLATASESLAIFLSQTLSQQTEMRPALRQLCVQVSCAIHSHSSVADHFQDVPLITRNGKLMGVKLNMRLFLISNILRLTLNLAMLSLTIARDFQLQKFFEKASIAQVLHNFRIGCILLDLLSCRNM